MPSSTDYANRLRAEAQRLLDSRTAALQQVVESLKGQLSASLDQVEAGLVPLRSMELPQAEAAIAEAMQEATAEFQRASREERERTLGSLAQFSNQLRKRETQEEILNLLLDTAANFAPRIALFIAREESFFGWSSRGFSAPTGQEISTWSCARAESPFLMEALCADGLISAGERSVDARLAGLLGKESRFPWHAFPLRAIRRPVAILVAGPAEDRGCELETLCLLLDLTGLSIENLALKILQEMRQTGAHVEPVQETATETAATNIPAPVRQPAAETANVPAAAQMPAQAEESPVAAHTQAVSAAAGAALEASPALMEEKPAAPEFPGMPASGPEVEAAVETPIQPESVSEPPVPEEEAPPPEAAPISVAAEEAAPQAAPQVPPPATAEAELPKATKLKEVQPLSEEEKLHSEARRFARLLVSEVKLYNEQQVAEGRANRDLYYRLRRDIDRSRELYEKRVSALVARKVDYFHDEVIRILAGNDPAALGKDYPGPRVAE